jgi:rhomboid protease GluP
MNRNLIITGVAECLTIVSALVCAIRLRRFSTKVTDPQSPIVAVLIIGVTSVVTGLQFFFPEILSEFRRNWDALRAGEWWRMVTPLFVQAYGWQQCCFNGITALFLLPLAEKFYGKRLLALYFISGIVGETFNYAWSPTGAGSSLGIYGVMGGLFTFACCHRTEISRSTIIFAIFGLSGAFVASFCRDGHGPSMLTGALLAGMMTSRFQTVPKKPPNQSSKPSAAAAVAEKTEKTLPASRNQI